MQTNPSLEHLCSSQGSLRLCPRAVPSAGHLHSRWGSHGTQLHQATHRVLVQSILAGQAQHVHGAAVGQGAWRGRLVGGQELMATMLLLQGQDVGQRGLGGQVGHGGGRCGLAQRQAGTGRAQAGLSPRQVQLVAGEAGLALQQRRGCGLQNEFGALNALVLVTLQKPQESATRRRRKEQEEEEEEEEKAREGCKKRDMLVMP